MAGHPLRPATRQSLGRPLPHQQADRPRAHPPPENLSPHTHACIWEYRVLAPISGRYPQVKGRLLTCYSPVRRSSTPEGAFPLDLHVLSTPPAFVLSQDQTLHRKQTPTPTQKGQHEKKRATSPDIQTQHQQKNTVRNYCPTSKKPPPQPHHTHPKRQTRHKSR